MKRQVRLLPLLPLLTACASTPPQPPEPTLAALEQALPPLPPTGGNAADRQRAIEGYQRFLDQAEDPLLRAEAMRRLADLSLEEQEARRAAAAEPPPDSDNRRIIALYEERLAAYPYHPKNDEVLYQLARAYENEGLPEQALAALDRLVSGYPHSPLLPEVQFRRGEMLFVRRDYHGADQAYRAVLGRGPGTPFYETALYKRGWSLFKQSRYFEGIDLFLELIDRRSRDGRLDLDALSRADREQTEDALRAISLSFGYLDGPETVAEYFRMRGDRRYELTLYEALGAEYLKKERFSDAAATYQAFVAAYPGTDEAPQLQLRAIAAYRQGGFPSQMLEAQQAYVRLFDLRSPYWRNRNPDDHPQVVAQLQASLRDLARHYHALAQKEKRAADYKLAGDWYQRYLDNFPSTAGAQEMRFLYAELLYEQGDYPAAVEQYQQVAYRYSRNGRAAEAGYAALQAFDAHARTLDGEARLAWQRRALESARRFARDFPHHPKAAAALVHAAQRSFELGDGDAAATAAQELLASDDADPASRLAAWTMLGHIAFDAGNLLKAEDAYRRALALGVADDQHRRALEDRLAATLYEQGKRRRESGELAAAARLFQRAADAAASPEIAATARFDAAAAALANQDWQQAATTLERFRADYPKHPQLIEATRRLAVAYLESGQTERAAAEYERLAASGEPALQRESLLRAAELRREAGQPQAARRLLLSYVERFPQPVLPALEARQQLIELAEQRGDAAELRRLRQALIEAEARAGAERNDRSRYLAAQASLALARELDEAARAVRLVEPLQRNLLRKKSLLEQALAAYAAADGYGVAQVSTAASYAIGALYADFARALLESEPPRGLKGEALAEYRLLLEEEALPFEEKAIEVHELNIRRTRQGLYDPWIRQSYAELARLVPVRYAKSERSERFVDAMR